MHCCNQGLALLTDTGERAGSPLPRHNLPAGIITMAMLGSNKKRVTLDLLVSKGRADGSIYSEMQGQRAADVKEDCVNSVKEQP